MERRKRTPGRKSSGFKGVSFRSDKRTWTAQICGVGGRPGLVRTLGSFGSEEQAARAYDDAAVAHVRSLLGQVESEALALGPSKRATARSKLEEFLSRLRINLEGRLDPEQASVVARARRLVAAAGGGDDDDDDDDDDDEDKDGAETHDGREKKKRQRSSPAPPPPPPPPRFRVSTAVVVPLYTPYDCEGSLQLPDDAAALFDSALDGFLNKKDKKAEPDLGCSFEQKVVVVDDGGGKDGKVFSVVVDRIPKDEAALAASAPGPATAFLALGGPGWLALSKELGLAPGRSVRFESDVVVAGGGGGRGERSRSFVRASMMV